ncbi:MAG: glycosyltransferase, partial [Ignavibacteria bacterium]|nr:glycosyltransferase [Ignavibacteria bacterium]
FLLKEVNSNAKIISVFSDTTIENRVHNAKGTKGNKLIFSLLKAKWYNKVFERSDLILANTNETAEILKNISKKNFDKKLRTYGLGFDSNKYFYSENLRKDMRSELGLNDAKKLLVTISRIYEGKPFEFWVEQVKDFLLYNEEYVYLLAGFNDTDYSRKTEKKLSELGLKDKLILHKFTAPEETNKIFNAADYSLWFAPTISIQQSMATGVFAIAPFDSTLDHLIENNKTGLYYNDFGDLKNKLELLNNIHYDREANSKFNQKFSYQNILQKAISEVS